MKKKSIVTILAITIIALIIGGCAPASEEDVWVPIPEVPIIDIPTGNTTDPITELSGIPDSVKNGGNPAISPAVVTIANYYLGGRVEYDLTVFNGTSETMSFAIAPRIPDNTREGYAKCYSDITSWVTVADPIVSVASMQLATVLIVLQVPEGSAVPGQQWEFWISVIPTGQTMVITEMAARWLVNMKV